jgi:hypothetical protein
VTLRISVHTVRLAHTVSVRVHRNIVMMLGKIAVIQSSDTGLHALVACSANSIGM